MLVLTRKVDQGIVIAGNIYIRVLGVERDRVKIGIAAPRDIPVLRQELLERDKAEAGKNSSGKEQTDSQPDKSDSELDDSDSKPAAAGIDSPSKNSTKR